MRWLFLLALVAAATWAADGSHDLHEAVARVVATRDGDMSVGPAAGTALLLAEAAAALGGDDAAPARSALLAEADREPGDSPSAVILEGITTLAWAARLSGDDARRDKAALAIGRLSAAVADVPLDRVDLAQEAVAIGLLAEAGRALDLAQAVAIVRTQTEQLRAARWDEARGLRGSDGGAAGASAYDALIASQIALYEATGDVAALTWAVALQDRLDRDFWDEAAGGYRGEAPDAALDLVRLARITDDDAYAERSHRILATARARGVDWAQEPLLLAAWLEDAAPVLHLTLIGGPDEPGTAALLAAAHAAIVPGFAITVLDESEPCRALRRRFPAMPLMPREGAAPTAYLCTASACDPPTTDPAHLAQRIRERSTR